MYLLYAIALPERAQAPLIPGTRYYLSQALLIPGTVLLIPGTTGIPGTTYPRYVTVWNFRGEMVTRFEDHVLWHPDSNTNNIYITSTQDYIFSYCRR